MTPVHVVPCGISVLDKLGSKIPGGGSAVGAFVRLVEKGAWLRGIDADAADGEHVLGAWKAKAASKADAAGLTGAVAKRLSAETHSLFGRSPAGPLMNGGHVVLPASATDVGISGAFCVGHYLTGGDPSKLSYACTPKGAGRPLQLELGSPGVTVVRVRGLKPYSDEFVNAVEGIGQVLRTAWETERPVEVHLTGGFKATLLHTLAMTEVLYSMSPSRVSAWYVFEDIIDTADETPVSPVRIGLRRFEKVILDDMRNELSYARRGLVHLGSRTFKGTAWDETANGPRLNPFGYGYLAVLGENATRVGDDKS